MGFKIRKLGLDLRILLLLLIIFLIIFLCIQYFSFRSILPDIFVGKKAGGDHVIAALPKEMCAENLKKSSGPKPVLDVNAKSARAWQNVESNILVAALIISKTSVLGKKIRKVCALAGHDPYDNEKDQLYLEAPHITVLGLQVPNVTKNTLHEYLISESGFSAAVDIIVNRVKKYILNKKIILHSYNKKYLEFDNKVVKKFLDKKSSRHNFIDKVHKPFTKDVINSLLELIGQDVVSTTRCRPAIVEPGKPNDVFTHYISDKSDNDSEIAVHNEFTGDFSPHISLINSPDATYRTNFIKRIQAVDTRELNRIELSSAEISHIFILYKKKAVYLPVD
jgi:hypothetical protein